MSETDLGMLAIIYGIDQGKETDYLHWVTREHTLERVSITGFQRARIFKSDRKVPTEYLTLYSLANAAVMASPEYLERLNDPTPWSQRIMPLMQGMTRGGGSIIHAAVDGEGAFVSVLRLERAVLDGLGEKEGRDLVEGLARLDRIASVRMLEVDQEATGIQTNEKGIRGKDMSFDGLLIIEGLDAESVRAAAQHAGQRLEQHGFPVSSEIDTYSAIFSRRKPD